MMAVACMMTGCSKSDDGGADVPTTTDPTTQQGTWIYTNEAKEICLAMTFDGADNVLINLEGVWFFGKMKRTDGHLTMTGSQIEMASFTDFGTFTAKVLPLSITIDCDYRMQGGLLHISNIKTTPNLQLKLLPAYGLKYDRVYKGKAVII